MQTRINEIDKRIKHLEQEWQELVMEHERAEMLLLKASEDGKKDGISLKEALSQQIFEQETMMKMFQKEKDYLQNSKVERSKQQELWGDLKKLFDVKTKCYHENKMNGIGGTLSVTKGAETFILQ